jgi:hypothetical protein
MINSDLNDPVNKDLVKFAENIGYSLIIIKFKSK